MRDGIKTGSLRPVTQVQSNICQQTCTIPGAECEFRWSNGNRSDIINHVSPHNKNTVVGKWGIKNDMSGEEEKQLFTQAKWEEKICKTSNQFLKSRAAVIGTPVSWPNSVHYLCNAEDPGTRVGGNQLLALNVEPSRTFWKESSLETTVRCNWGHSFNKKQTTMLILFFTGCTQLSWPPPRVPVSLSCIVWFVPNLSIIIFLFF